MVLPVRWGSFTYADDGVLLVAVDSRRDLEDRAKRAYETVLE